MNTIMRLSYMLAWVFAALAVIYRGLEIVAASAVQRLPLSSRHVLFFSGFLFVATIATAAYAQATGSAQASKSRSTAA